MSVYEPAQDGLPAYFLPMLDDADRNALYERAISQCVARFSAEQGRPPLVLDLGCGTGMLSIFALRAGARHVVALDVNRHMAELARRALDAEGFKRGRCERGGQFEVVCGSLRRGRTRASYAPAAPFDVLVSEILGTLATSEGIYEHTQAVLPFLNRFAAANAAPAAPAERVYVVPAAVSVTAAVWRFEALYSASPRAREPMRQALEGVLRVPEDTGETPLMSSQNLALPLHLLAPRRLTRRAAVRVDTFEPAPPAAECADAADAPAPPSAAWLPRQLDFRAFAPLALEPAAADADGAVELASEDFLVLEWTARLFGDGDDAVVLRNEIDALAAMPPRNAQARHAQWGFLFGRAAHPDAPARAAGLSLKAAGWDKGIPTVHLRSQPPQTAASKRPATADDATHQPPVKKKVLDERPQPEKENALDERPQPEKENAAVPSAVEPVAS